MVSGCGNSLRFEHCGSVVLWLESQHVHGHPGDGHDVSSDDQHEDDEDGEEAGPRPPDHRFQASSSSASRPSNARQGRSRSPRAVRNLPGSGSVKKPLAAAVLGLSFTRCQLPAET